MRRVTILAWLCLEVATAQELAVVRPFASSQEIQDMDRAFAIWNTVSPCGDKAFAEFDLILVYSRKFEENPDAVAAVDRIVLGFREGNEPWHRCFRAVHVKAANLTAHEDVYDSRGYTVRKDWVNGPNKVFSYVLRSFLESRFSLADYAAFYFMEFDSVPLRSMWLDQLYAEVVVYPRAAIRGSRYRGDSWDPFLAEIPTELLQHINGNAIYFKHPWLQFLADQLEEDAASDNSSIAFDVRMAALTLQASREAAENDTTLLAEAWKQHVPEGEQPYRDDSLLVGNYANTLLNNSFDSGEFVRHASLNNVLHNIETSQLTLVVVAYDDWSQSLLLKSLKEEHHPFRNVLVLSDVEGAMEIETPRGPTRLQETAWAGAPETSLCDAALAVTTTSFVLTDTYHFIAGPVQLLANEDGHPVLPYIPASSNYCTGSRECSSALDQAEAFFGVELLYHHDTFETVFFTDDVRAFCETWGVAADALGSYENCDYLLGPTADDYIAWLISMSRPFRYVPKNKERVGWRPWTTLWTPPPPDPRDCGLYGETEYAAQLASISECSLLINVSACESSPNCTFRPLFESGKCIQTWEFALLPKPPRPVPLTSTTWQFGKSTTFTHTDTTTSASTRTSTTVTTSRTISTTLHTHSQTHTLGVGTCQVPDIADVGDCYSLLPGETCQVPCPAGYQGTPSQYICQANLTLSGEEPECIRTTTPSTADDGGPCSAGLPISAGTDVSDCLGIIAGATCTARCAGSFSGLPVQYFCTADGTFQPVSATLECQERFCSTSQLPSGFDTASCALASVGEACFVRCPFGYLPAESLYVCAADGSFLGFEPTCELADCSLSLASKATDGSRNFSDCSGIRAMSACTVPCAYGYQGDASTYSCLPDGTLQGAESNSLCARRTCSIPDALMDPSFGFGRACFGIRHGEACLAACNAGFSGLSEPFVCDNGSLHGSVPKCTGFVCSLEGVWLEEGMNASDCVGKSTLETCSIQCRRGYSRHGSPEMTCQADGRFTQHEVRCLPKACGYLSAVPSFSAASIGSSCAGLGFGEICSAFCQEGFDLQGNATVLVCDDAPSSSAGFSVYFESNASYLHAIEADGPLCQARPCTANVPNLQGLLHDCEGKRTAETCIVEAAAGYHFSAELATPVTLTCQPNGSFTGDIPPIVSDSCSETQFGTGVGSTCTNIPVDAGCWAYCESGWSGLPREYHCRLNLATDVLELQAVQGEINCTSTVRRLDVSDPGTCNDLNELAATAGFLPHFKHSCNEMMHGDVCVVHCREGWEMVELQPTLITCENSSLIGGPLPRCLPKRCSFAFPNTLGIRSNCSEAVTGEYCLATCEEGYFSTLEEGGGDGGDGTEGEDVGLFLCTAAGSFHGRSPDCRRQSCADLELQTTFQHNCHDKVVGETCVVTCAAGFYFGGWGALFTCDAGGSFRGELPFCQPATCETLSDDATLVSKCSSAATGESCNIACRPGFYQNSSALTCDVTGNLVGQLPICRPKTCAADPVLFSTMYDHNCVALPFGRSCSVVCAGGYESDEGEQGEQWQCALNDANQSEDSELVLTGRLPSCRPAACHSGYPLQTAAARNNCTQMLTGQICVQSCADGYLPSATIVDTFRCNPDGVLTSISHTVLNCRAATCNLTDLTFVVPGIATTCAGEIAMNTSCSAFCSPGFTLKGPVQHWSCTGPDSELPALYGSDQEVTLRGHFPACAPNTCAYNIPWEIAYDHNCSAVPTGSFCLAACRGESNSSILRCFEDGALLGDMPLCHKVQSSSGTTTTSMHTTTSTQFNVLTGMLVVQASSLSSMADPEVRAGLIRALAQLLQVGPEVLELAVEPIQGSADQAELHFSSAESLTAVQLDELQRKSFAEVRDAIAAELVNTEAGIDAVGPLVVTVRLPNETLEVIIAPLGVSPPDTLPLTTTVSASASLLLCCCACAGCFCRQRMRQVAEGSGCSCLCAGASDDHAASSEVASDMQTSVGEATSDSWDWEDEGVTRTLPPSREVTAGISSLVMSTAGSGCPTRSPTTKDLRDTASNYDTGLGVLHGEHAEDANATAQKLEALVHGVGFEEPLVERLADAGIYLQEWDERDGDGEDWTPECRLALEDVGVYYDEEASTDPQAWDGRAASGKVGRASVADSKLARCIDEGLFEV